MSKTVTLYTSEECDAKYVPFSALDDCDYCVSLAIDGSNLLCDWFNPATGTYSETSLTLPSGGGSSYNIGSTVVESVKVASTSNSKLCFTVRDTSAGTTTTYQLVYSYNQTTANVFYSSTNYANGGTSWTYKNGYQGGTLGSVYMIRYYTNASGGGVAFSTSSGTFSETATTTVAISTAPINQWGTLTVWIPSGAPYYMFTKGTTYVYVRYVLLKQTATDLIPAFGVYTNTGGGSK